MYKFKYLLPENIKWNLSDVLIVSHLDYGLEEFSNFPTRQFINKLQMVQNCCFDLHVKLVEDCMLLYYIPENTLKTDVLLGIILCLLSHFSLRTGRGQKIIGIKFSADDF